MLAMRKLLLALVGITVIIIVGYGIFGYINTRKLQEKDRQQTSTIMKVLDSIAIDLNIEGLVDQQAIGHRSTLYKKGNYYVYLYPEVSNYYQVNSTESLNIREKLATAGWSKVEIEHNPASDSPDYLCVSNERQQGVLACVEEFKELRNYDYIGVGDTGFGDEAYFGNRRNIKQEYNLIVSVLDISKTSLAN